jgi:hypothetical protein
LKKSRSWFFPELRHKSTDARPQTRLRTTEPAP